MNTKRRGNSGFTLVEMLAAIAVLLIILGIIGAATNGARSTMLRSTNAIGEFAVARSAFENMSQKLSQATLNTYWDYFDATGKGRGYYAAAGTTGTFVPATYGRMSDLHFFVRQNSQQYFCGQEVFFQTPVAYSQKYGGTAQVYPYQDCQGLMNACSYYVSYCTDKQLRPTLITGTNKFRYRLLQGLEGTENFGTYKDVANVLASGTQPLSTQKTNTAVPSPSPWLWTNNLRNEYSAGGAGPYGSNLSGAVYSIADNVIELVVWPRLPVRQDPVGSTLNGLSEATPTADYSYDSQGDLNVLPTSTKAQALSDEQLPPIVQLTMVAIDEASASRLAASTSGSTPPPAIKTAFANAKTASGTSATTLFQVSTQDQYTKDLVALGNALSAAKINYKIFNTFVVMRESKWSQ